jgi:hypothetical protein
MIYSDAFEPCLPLLPVLPRTNFTRNTMIFKSKSRLSFERGSGGDTGKQDEDGGEVRGRG